MEDIKKGMAVASASLITQGLVEQLDNGLRITEAGKSEALRRWMQLPGENRLLFTFLFERLGYNRSEL